jgi:WD40 repeat protein
MNGTNRFIQLCKLLLVSGLLVACSGEKPPLNSWQHSQYGSYAAAFSPDKRYALVGDTEQPAKLWDLETGKIKYSWQNQPEEAGTTTDVAFSADGKIAATCESKTIVLWRVADGKPQNRLTFPVAVKDMAVSPDGSHLLLALQDRSAVYFDVRANAVRQIFEHDGKAVNSPVKQLINTVAISADGRLGLTGGDDRTARLWDLSTGEQLRQWQHATPVSLVSFNPQGDFVITSAGNDQTRMWSLSNGQQIAVLNTSPIPVDGPWGDFPVFKTTTTALGYSADNRFIVSGHPNQEICTWRAVDGENIACWQAPRREALKPGVVLQAVTFSADGRHVLSEAGNGLAQQWGFQHD